LFNKEPDMSRNPNDPPAQAKTDRDVPRDEMMAAIATSTLKSPLIMGADGREHILLPEGFKTADISDPHRFAARPAHGQITVDESGSLVAYTNRHQNKDTSAIFADYDAGTITARLDWHFHNDTGRFTFAGVDRHRVSLKLRDSEEWKRWHKMQGALHAQADFALFLEENAADIHHPEPSIFIELARDLEAASGMTFKQRNRLDNGDTEFSFSEESRITNKAVVPDSFTLMIPLYNGETAEEVQAKFRWKATPSGLQLGFIWHRAEYIRQARFGQIATNAAEETGLPVYFGRLAG
jgi:uncharacterized protein YfdQ (DUF2303 family)